MNINQLKIFYLAAKYGSLSNAAEVLYITQPAVTKGIQRLQDFYDLKFFNRFGKKLVLTDAGEVLYRIAESIFEMEAQAEETLRDFQQRKKGFIRIHASESFGAYYLPSILNRFSKAHPQIRVAMEILPTDLIVDKTVTLNNDLGFISYAVEHKKLIMREVLEDRYMVIAPAGHPLTQKDRVEAADLEGQAMILHEKNSAPRIATENFLKKQAINVSVPLELSNNEAIKRAVEQGIGIAVITRRVANEEIQTGTLKAIPFADPTLTRKFYMIHHKDKYLSKTLLNLIELIDQWAAEYIQGRL